jgi:hypothetical protein
VEGQKSQTIYWKDEDYSKKKKKKEKPDREKGEQGIHRAGSQSHLSTNFQRMKGWGGRLQKEMEQLLTILDLQEILYQVLHKSILLSHIPLEVDHFLQDVLVISFDIPNMRKHVFLSLRQAIDLGLKGFECGGRWRSGVGPRRRG